VIYIIVFAVGVSLTPPSTKYIDFNNNNISPILLGEVGYMDEDAIGLGQNQIF